METPETLPRSGFFIIVYRPLPSDVEIEEQAIGILLSLEDEPHKLSRGLMALEPEDFHSEACRGLFKAAVETHKGNVSILYEHCRGNASKPQAQEYFSIFPKIGEG